MSIEQALLAGLSATTTALVWAVTKLWAKSEECEADRRGLRTAIEDLRAEHGHARGRLEVFERCTSDHCPFVEQTLRHHP
jgi:hypothetical protein